MSNSMLNVIIERLTIISKDNSYPDASGELAIFSNHLCEYSSAGRDSCYHYQFLYGFLRCLCFAAIISDEELRIAVDELMYNY